MDTRPSVESADLSGKTVLPVVTDALGGPDPDAVTREAIGRDVPDT